MKKALIRITVILVIFLLLFVSYEVYMSLVLRGEPSGDTWSEADTFNPDDINKLIKTDGEDFHILLFSDIQLGINPFSDGKALKLVDDMVGEIQPDLILTTGDNSMFSFADFAAKRLVSQMESYDILWAVTLGNHDSEGRADRNWHGNLYRDADYSLFEMGPDNVQGVGNYVIDITNESGEPIYAIIMMDSNITREYDGEKDYDYIYPDQISWYEWAVRGQRDVPSILVFHIPLPEFSDAYDLWQAGDIDASLGVGEKRERVCAPPYNTGFFEVIDDLNNTTDIFVGHDHVNCYSIMFEDVRLSYGLKTGPASYNDDDLSGAVLITIKDGTNEIIIEYLYR